MTPVFLSDSVWLHFGTSSATTGAATNADSTPAVTVAEDGADMGYSPTVSNVATGLYKVQIDATAANGFEAGRRYSAYVVATVGGIVGRDGIGEFEVLAVDLNTGTASVTGLTPGNLDVAVSSRLATASYTAPDNANIALIAADTNDIQTRIPAALVSGRMDASVGAMATDTITAAAVAASAVTEIQAGLATSAALATAQADVTTILGDTNDIQTRIPAALVSGRMDASVGAMATDTITAAAVAASAVTEIQAGLSTLDAVGVRAAVGLAAANLDTQLTTIDDFLDTEVLAIKAKTDNLPAAPAAVSDIPTLAAILAGIGTRLVESGLSQDEVTRILLSALSGTTTGIGTSQEKYKSIDGLTDRITVDFDANSNRTTVVLVGT